MRRLTALAPLGVALGALIATPAGAAASGTNGQITFARQIPAGGADVFVTNPDGSNVHQVPLVYPAEDYGIPIWSPDRSRLLIPHVLRFDASGNLLRSGRRQSTRTDPASSRWSPRTPPTI